jgi:hypothetical protein
MVLGLSLPLAIGIFALWLGVGNVWHSFASAKWPRTAGKVLKAETLRELSTDRTTRITSTRYVANIVLGYQVNGQEYSTPNIYFGLTVGSDDSSTARSCGSCVIQSGHAGIRFGFSAAEHYGDGAGSLTR